MDLKYSVSDKYFHFKRPATTSRGVYLTRHSYFIELMSSDSSCYGIGECANLPNLSCDDIPDYAEVIDNLCSDFCLSGVVNYEKYRNYPSILFGLETAIAHLRAGSLDFFGTHFAKGEVGIPINGLVWMGTYNEMSERVAEKLEEGYHCIKLKVGAIDFDNELAMVRHLRSDFPAGDLEIRLDANGGFSFENALDRLKRFSDYDIHSIEQPIRQGDAGRMAYICSESPIPVALDEELIGVNDYEYKKLMLNKIRPAYLVIKPSLHGGMRGTEEWVGLAESMNIGSWITSALESNVGLNAIAQLAAKIYGPDIKFPQGLGTGQLFTDNIPYPLEIKDNKLWLNSNES